MKRALKGHARLITGVLDHRLPVTLDVLHLLKTRPLRAHLITVWSTFILVRGNSSILRFLRVGEFALQSQGVANHSQLRLSDVKRYKNKVAITRRNCKTDQFRHGYTVIFLPTHRSVCPFKALTHSVEKRKGFASKERALFLFQDLSSLTRVKFIGTTKRCLHDIPKLTCITAIASVSERPPQPPRPIFHILIFKKWVTGKATVLLTTSN